MSEYKHRVLNYALVCVLATSFALKLAGGWYLRDGFLNRGNSHTALNAIAKNLVQHGQFSVEPGVPSVDYEPGYPLMLATAFKLFGTQWFGVMLFQAMLYAGASYLLFLICLELGSRFAGVFAAAIHSFYPFLFVHTVSVIDTTIFVFLVYWVVWSLLACKNRGKTWHYLSLGIAGALALLTRGAFVALGPALAIYFVVVIWKQRDSGGVKKALACALATAVLMGPWLYRNYQLTGRLLISTHGPFGVWQGNNDRALQLLKDNLSLDEVYKRKPLPEIYQKYPMQAREPNQAMFVADAYREEAKSFIFSHPRQFFELALWKFVKLWSPVYNPVAGSFAFGGAALRQIVYAVSYVPILLLALPGVFLLYKRKPAETRVLLGMVATYTLAHMIAMGYSRLRLPIDPILMVFAAFCLAELGTRWGAKHVSATIPNNQRQCESTH